MRLVVTYGGETWMMTQANEIILRTIERKILRRTYRPTKKADGGKHIQWSLDIVN